MHLVRIAVIILASVLVARAQNPGAPVNVSQGPPPVGYQSLLYYTGSNLQYVCLAASDQINEQEITVTAASNANPVSFTATAHGFDYQSGATTLPAIKITGGTVNWTPINGVWVATPTSANAFTIAVNSTGFGALTGTLTVTTRAPLTTKSYWSVQKLVYDGSSNLIGTFWGSTPGGAGSTALTAGGVAMNKICANRAALAYQ